MSNDLIDPDDLAHLAGAPFSEEEIDTAVMVLRAACGWRIAPTATETITIDVMRYQNLLRLPTLKLVAVEEIRDMTNLVDVSGSGSGEEGTVIDPATYQVSTNAAKVRRRGVWPHGYGALEVDMTHGYSVVPGDLLPVIAESAARVRRDQTARSMGDGPYSVTFGDITAGTLGSPLSSSASLDRYLLHQPGMV